MPPNPPHRRSLAHPALLLSLTLHSPTLAPQLVLTNGTIAGISVTVQAVVASKEARAAGSKAFVLTALAYDASASTALGTIFPDTPQFVLEILRPASFSLLNFTWDGSFDARGSPDLSSVPGLSTILSYLKLSQDDVQIVPMSGAIAVEIQRSWTLSLGDPFIGDSELDFAIGFSQNGADTSFFVSANFIATAQLSFLESEQVSFNLGAKVSYDSTAPPPSVSFGLSAYVTSQMAIKGFPFIVLDYIGGEVALTPMVAPPFVSIESIAFAANGSVLDTAVGISVLYDQPKGDFGVQFSLANLDLQVRGRGGARMEVWGRGGTPMEVRGRGGTPMEVRGRGGAPRVWQGRVMGPGMCGRRGASLEVRGRGGTPTEVRGKGGSHGGAWQGRDPHGGAGQGRVTWRCVAGEGPPRRCGAREGHMEVRGRGGTPTEVRGKGGSHGGAWQGRDPHGGAGQGRVTWRCVAGEGPLACDSGGSEGPLVHDREGSLRSPHPRCGSAQRTVPHRPVAHSHPLQPTT